jgi:type II secretory pathway pseudopilin PulG
MHNLRSQAGFAMPVVIGVTAIMMLLVALGITLATRSTQESRGDRNVKVARQTADAGLEIALMRTNQALAGNAAGQPCLTKDAAGNLVYSTYATGGQWCAPVTETLPDGTTTTYQLSAEQLVPGSNPPLYTRKIVATGRARGETRRVYAEMSARQGQTGFGIYGISARDHIFFQNSASAGTPEDPVDVRTNGNIRMENSSHICGNVTPGPGKSLTRIHPASICAGKSTTPAATQLLFPDYAEEHDAAKEENDNARLGCGGGANKDACDGNGNVSWNAGSRQLAVQNNSSLTLGGNTYSMCRLALSNNAKLYIAARPAGAPPLRIYFDDPSNCPGVPSEQILIENGTGITNLNTDPVTLQFFVRGSTIVDFKNNSNISQSTPMMLYAPNATVTLQNHARITGGLVGKTVELKNNVTFSYDADAATPVGNSALIYQPTQQRECTVRVAAGGTPDAGC